MHRILVIEDSTEYRDFIAELLRLSGYELLEAADGEAGIQAAHDGTPDLIICDLHLPLGNGFYALQAIRRNEGPRHVPFLFVSGDTDPEHIQRGLNLGAEAYLTKPLSAHEFVTTVRRFIPEEEPARDR